LIPEPVIEGFTIGIAVVIAVSQLKDLTGLTTAPLPAEFLPKVTGLWAARATLNVAAFALGAGCIAALLILRRLAPRIPWMVAVIALASVLTAWAMPSVATVSSRYGMLPSGIPWPHLPRGDAHQLWVLLPSGFTIALLAGIESLLSAIVADRMIEGSHRSNAELIAQGAANLAAPLFGGLPTTGAIARTATNVNAGGRTPVAGIVHALVILAAMAVAARLAGALALPALAALLIVAAWNMSEPARWRDRIKLPRAELALLLLTSVLTVLVDLTLAIAVGTVIGLVLRFRTKSADLADWHTPQSGPIDPD
jgi:SulP family sulfate permease